MKTRPTKCVAVCAMLILFSAPGHADTKPWRAGEPRMKFSTACGKSRCSTRADFSASKPHHHHGDRVVFGSDKHTRHCAHL